MFVNLFICIEIESKFNRIQKKNFQKAIDKNKIIQLGAIAECQPEEGFYQRIF